MSAGQEAKEYAGNKRWSATLAVKQADAALAVKTDRGDGTSQTPAGLVSYWTGKKKRQDWIQTSCEQEDTFYKSVEDLRKKVNDETTKWIKDSNIAKVWTDGVAGGASIGIYGSDSCNTGGTQAQKDACNSPLKRLAAAMKAWNENKVSGSN